MGFQNKFGHREKIIFGALSGPVIGPYTTNFVNVVVSRGGSVTTQEQIYLTTFETSVGADLLEFDRLWIHGLSSNIAARTSFVNPSSTIITAVNNPLFTPSYGYTGAGGVYLNTNYNLSTNSVQYKQVSAATYVYSRTNTLQDATELGAVTTSPLAITQTASRLNSGDLLGDINSNNNTSSVVSDSIKLSVAVRTSAATNRIYKNGIALTTSGNTASALPNLDLFLLCRNVNGNPNFNTARQISLTGCSSSLVNQLNFYNAVQALGTSIGWAV